MYKIVILDNQELLDTLERIHYETIGRQHVIEYMCLNGMNKDDNYNSLWEEYLYYLRAYDILKNQVVENYLEPAVLKGDIASKYRWEINFDTNRIKVYENE